MSYELRATSYELRAMSYSLPRAIPIPIPKDFGTGFGIGIGEPLDTTKLIDNINQHIKTISLINLLKGLIFVALFIIAKSFTI